MEPMDFIRIVRALQELPEEAFKEVARASYPNANEDYIEEQWQKFIYGPQSYVANRNPIQPGLDLIEKAMELAGVNMNVIKLENLRAEIHVKEDHLTIGVLGGKRGHFILPKQEIQEWKKSEEE